MLPLDSPRWAQLRCAHGHGTDVVPFLRELAEGTSFSSLGSRFLALFWREGRECSAFYAALPHMVQSARVHDRTMRFAIWYCVGDMVARTPRAAIPDDLLPAYEEAVREARRLVLREILDGAWPERELLGLLEAFAGVHGDAVACSHLSDLVDGRCECPRCRGDA